MDIKLNEVLYDPPGADGGYEYVELASSPGADASASLQGWRLETGNGASGGNWTLAWVGGAADRLQEGLFLIGEGAVEPSPHVTTSLDLQNGPDACRLVSPDGEMDVLGWGEPLDPALREGASAPDVSGSSLARLPDGWDTQDNRADWRESEPSPGAFNAPDELLLVEVVQWPPADWPAGSAWTFRWRVKNAGRRAWAGPLRVECGVHPGERLGTVGLDTVESGHEVELEWSAAPSPGVHLPRAEPGGASAPHAWFGVGTDLVVSELMAWPADGGPEWVELRNVGPMPVDLAQFSWSDLAGTRGALQDTVAPGQYVVLASDPSAVRDRWAIPAAARLVGLSPWPSLNQTAAVGQVAERGVVSIGDREVAVGVVPGRGQTGVSWERVSIALPGEQVGSWVPSLDPSGGTPGFENSRRGDRPVPGGSARVQVHPRSFRPARDGAALVIIHTDALRCRVRVWDSTGRAVSELVSWRAAPAEHRAAWDGRRQDGTRAPLGLYLVTVQPVGEPMQRAPLVLVR